MLKRLSAREAFEQLIADFEPLLRNAFMENIQDIRSNIQIKRIVERLERNDIAGAIEGSILIQLHFARSIAPLPRPLKAAVLRPWRTCRSSVNRTAPSWWSV